MQRQLNISDLHIPYHDKHAWQLTLNIISVVKPDVINLLGDMLDFYKLSSFDKDPARFEDGGLQEDLDQWVHMAREMQVAAPKRCIYRLLPGNHEDRLRRYMWRNPELHGLKALELPNLMRLEELEIEYSANEIEIVPGKLVAKHGDIVRKDSAYSAKAEMLREGFAISTISGHTHRMGMYYASSRSGMFRAVENGCLCDCNPEYVKRPNWQKGITMVTTWDEDFHIDSIPYLGEGERIEAMVMGQLVRIS